MKTAVIYTGAMRSFARCLPTHHWHFLRHLGAVDFFVSTYRDGTEHEAESLRLKYPKSRVEIEIIDEQPDCVAEMRAKGVSLPDEWHKGVPYTHEPHAISVHPQAVLRQLWQLGQGWRLYSATTPKDADFTIYNVVVRCRPDLWFHEFKTPFADKDEHFMPGAHLPYWGRFGGANDRFALLGRHAAEAYFKTYDELPRLLAEGCPLHPESLVRHSLARATNRCTIYDNLRAEFSTLRKDGTMRPPEISASDIAHLAAS